MKLNLPRALIRLTVILLRLSDHTLILDTVHTPPLTHRQAQNIQKSLNPPLLS